MKRVEPSTRLCFAALPPSVLRIYDVEVHGTTAQFYSAVSTAVAASICAQLVLQSIT